MNCTNKNCGAPLPSHERFCVACGLDIGAPNVRKANESAEVAAVELRYSDELARSRAGGYHEALEQFENAMGGSIAIICMPPSRLLPLATDPNSLLSTFSLQIEGQSRVPEDNRFDQLRSSVEGVYFPNYWKYIRFASLSLSPIGHIAYGSCSVSIKDSSISTRASVFELPLFQFGKKYSIPPGDSVPFGHRATWERRGRLAVAKLGSKLSGGTVSLAEILLPTSADTLGDCIEVHVYGSLSRYSFEKVVMRKEKRTVDQLIQQAIFESLKENGVDVEMIP